MAGDIRVKTDVKYKTIYNDMKNFALGDMHELFFLCACLGYKHNLRKPLGPHGDDRFYSHTISPEEFACYYAMVLEKNDMDLSSIEDDKVVISEIEEYANGGMEYLIRELLSDYMTSEGILKLEKSGYAKELPKILLGFIHEQSI